jgi:hypothetical protein
MRRFIAPLILLGLAFSLSGCVVEGRGGGGWCFYHPHRC